VVNRIVLRRHVITLLPDILLFSASLLLFWAVWMLSGQAGQNDFALKGICELAAIVLAMIGFVDIVKWRGFRVILSPDCIELQRFWIFRNAYCMTDRKISVRLRQNALGEWLNMGSLIVYETGGSVITVEGLGNFNHARALYPQFSSDR